MLASITESGQYTLDESYSNYRLLYILMFKNSIIYSSIFDTGLLTAGYMVAISQGGYNIGLSFPNATSVSATINGASSIRIYGIK